MFKPATKLVYPNQIFNTNEVFKAEE